MRGESHILLAEMLCARKLIPNHENTKRDRHWLCASLCAYPLVFHCKSNIHFLPKSSFPINFPPSTILVFTYDTYPRTSQESSLFTSAPPPPTRPAAPYIYTHTSLYEFTALIYTLWSISPAIIVTLISPPFNKFCSTTFAQTWRAGSSKLATTTPFSFWGVFSSCFFFFTANQNQSWLKKLVMPNLKTKLKSSSSLLFFPFSFCCRSQHTYL